MLLGTALDSELAKRLKRTKTAIQLRRQRLSIPAFGRLSRSRYIAWGATELSMLGVCPDKQLAKIIGRTIEEVKAKRLELKRLQR